MSEPKHRDAFLAAFLGALGAALATWLVDVLKAWLGPEDKESEDA